MRKSYIRHSVSLSLIVIVNNSKTKMKTKNFTIIILLGIIMIACSPTKRDIQRIIYTYSVQNELYVCKLDSSNIEIQVMARDKYQAMKYFDSKLKESDIERDYTILTFPIDLLY